MDTVRRTLGSLLVPAGFRRSLLVATYLDESAPSDGDLEIVAQGLLGNERGLSRAECCGALRDRIRENWTWTVVLKTLMAIHRCLQSPCLTNDKLIDISKRLSIIELCQNFREGEGTDLQAESHARLIRLYTAYVLLLMSSWKRKNSNLKSLSGLGDPELLKYIREYSQLLSYCVRPFADISSTSDSSPRCATIYGFCPVTGAAFFALLRDATIWWPRVRMGGETLLARSHSIHPNDMNEAIKAYGEHRSAIGGLRGFCSFFPRLPVLTGMAAPSFDPPSQLPPKWKKRYTDDLVTSSGKLSLL